MKERIGRKRRGRGWTRWKAKSKTEHQDKTWNVCANETKLLCCCCFCSTRIVLLPLAYPCWGLSWSSDWNSECSWRSFVGNELKNKREMHINGYLNKCLVYKLNIKYFSYIFNDFLSYYIINSQKKKLPTFRSVPLCIWMHRNVCGNVCFVRYLISIKTIPHSASVCCLLTAAWPLSPTLSPE